MDEQQQLNHLKLIAGAGKTGVFIAYSFLLLLHCQKWVGIVAVVSLTAHVDVYLIIDRHLA